VSDRSEIVASYVDLIPGLIEAERASPLGSRGDSWTFYNIVSVPDRAGRLLDIVCRERGASDLRGSSVLDLGSGAGTVGLYFRLDGAAAAVIGVDLDFEALNFLSRAVLSCAVAAVEVVCGDMSAPPVASKAFDVVLIVDNLHYPGLDRERTLEAAYRALRPGGVLLVKVINGLFPGYAIASSPSARSLARVLPVPQRLRPCLDARYREAPTSPRLMRMVKRAGFDAVRVIDPRTGRDCSLRRWVKPHVIVVGTRPVRGK
jgi:SAM-dependent methyltransferase